MSAEEVSSQSLQPKQDVVRHRPPEVDKHVDQFLSTMCESSRRQILELLAQPKGDAHGPTLERRSTDIATALNLAPSTTSEHLKQLAQAGLITSRRDGKVIYYRIRNILLVHAFYDLLDALDTDHTLRLSELIDESSS